MKITKAVLKQLGFQETNSYVGNVKTSTNFKHANYPFNQLDLFWQDGVKLNTDDTNYNCSTLHKLLASVYFSGVNYGRAQKQKEIIKALGIKV